jgi:hypothetical protein
MFALNPYDRRLANGRDASEAAEANSIEFQPIPGVLPSAN